MFYSYLIFFLSSSQFIPPFPLQVFFGWLYVEDVIVRAQSLQQEAGPPEGGQGRGVGTKAYLVGLRECGGVAQC